MVAFVIETGATNRLIYIDQSGIHEVPMAVADATLGNPAVAGPDSIVFNSQRAGAQHIFRTALDGHVTQLTSGDDAQDRAVVSPDGSMIAYTTFNETRELGLRVADADGTNVRVVTPGGPPGAHGGDDQPTFSPDGKWLAFVRIDPNVERRAGIFVISIDGTGERRLTDDALDAGHPRWSPDGTKILYGQHVDATEFVSQPLSVVDVASGVSTPLADAKDGGGAFDGDWSPDGTQVIYVYYIPGWNNNELRVANADGTGARAMWAPDANDGGGVDRPDWGG
jgi:Tol biopolymer transport system component